MLSFVRMFISLWGLKFNQKIQALFSSQREMQKKRKIQFYIRLWIEFERKFEIKLYIKIQKTN